MEFEPPFIGMLPSVFSDDEDAPIKGTPLEWSIVHRTREPVNYEGDLPVVDYLRRDRRNGRFPRPRYLNLLVHDNANGVVFNLHYSDEQGRIDDLIAYNLPYKIEKGDLLRINVDCINPEMFARSETCVFALHCRDCEGHFLGTIPFIVNWWKRREHRKRKPKHYA